MRINQSLCAQIWFNSQLKRIYFCEDLLRGLKKKNIKYIEFLLFLLNCFSNWMASNLDEGAPLLGDVEINSYSLGDFITEKVKFGKVQLRALAVTCKKK